MVRVYLIGPFEYTFIDAINDNSHWKLRRVGNWFQNISRDFIYLVSAIGMIIRRLIHVWLKGIGSSRRTVTRDLHKRQGLSEIRVVAKMDAGTWRLFS